MIDWRDGVDSSIPNTRLSHAPSPPRRFPVRLRRRAVRAASRPDAVSSRRDDDPGGARRDALRPAHLPRARQLVPRAHRGVRQARPVAQRDHRRQLRRARDRRLARQALRVVASTRRPAPLRSDDRQGQLSDDRTADRGRLARAQGLRADDRRVHGRAHQGRGRDRISKVEHGGVRVLARRDGELAAARLHAESVRARSRDRRLVGRKRGRRCGGSWRSGTRYRHRKFHSWPELAPGARRHSADDGAHESRGDRAAQSLRRHGRADGAHRRGRGGRAASRRRL